MQKRLKFVCACRTYCETDIDPAHRKLSQLQAVLRYLTGKEPDMQCKKKPERAANTQLIIVPQNFLEPVMSCMYVFPFCFLKGDEVLLQQTLFDAVVTAPMEAYWTALMLNTSG